MIKERLKYMVCGKDSDGSEFIVIDENVYECNAVIANDIGFDVTITGEFSLPVYENNDVNTCLIWL